MLSSGRQPQLESVELLLSKCKMSSNALKNMAQFLTNSENLKKVNISLQSNKKIDDKCASVLIDSINSLKKLSSLNLDLNNTNIGDRTVRGWLSYARSSTCAGR